MFWGGEVAYLGLECRFFRGGFRVCTEAMFLG